MILVLIDSLWETTVPRWRASGLISQHLRPSMIWVLPSWPSPLFPPFPATQLAVPWRSHAVSHLCVFEHATSSLLYPFLPWSSLVWHLPLNHPGPVWSLSRESLEWKEPLTSITEDQQSWWDGSRDTGWLQRLLGSRWHHEPFNQEPGQNLWTAFT